MKKYFVVFFFGLFQASADNGLQEQLIQFEVTLKALENTLEKQQAEKAEPTTHFRSTFFKDIIGITENAFLNLYQDNVAKIKSYIRFDDQGNAIIVGEDKEYQAGKFSALSIGELRDATKNINKGNGSFNVIEAISPSGKNYRKFVDVGAMQADPANKDAVFQVASNFNALELVSKNDPMNTISGYISDTTQGPFASISAAPGLIYRHYFIFYDENQPPIEWKQTVNKQINLLDNTPIPVTNSYVDFSKKSPSEVGPIDIEKIKIGFHQREQVTFGFLISLSEHQVINNPQQIINQIFTAAVDFGSNHFFKNDPQAQNIAQTILDAAYEGAIRAAAQAGKNKLFLTLIGGGVFGNPWKWIAQAIEKNREFIMKSGLEVYLVIYDGSSEVSGSPFRKVIEGLVKDTNGIYLRYSDQFPDGIAISLI